MYVTSEQVRAGRALLDWSRARLAEECGVHQNTLLNFENGKHLGLEETVAAIRVALEAAGVIFVAGGVRLRRFMVGDRVRFRRLSRFKPPSVRQQDIGRVVEVERLPAAASTYRMRVQFDHTGVLPLMPKAEFELVVAKRSRHDAISHQAE